MQVVVSINKGDYTITETEFQYYLNTDGSKCIAYGPGLLTNNAINEPTVFVIQAINTNKQNRESGADEFIVNITRPDKIKKEDEEEEPLAEGEQRPGTQEAQRQTTPPSTENAEEQKEPESADQQEKEGESAE